MTDPARAARPLRTPKRKTTVTTPDVADAVWNVAPPSGPVWTARPWVHPQERAEAGKAARKRVPRASHAAFEPRSDRHPIGILADQEADRLQNLVPLRHQRMAESAFAYYRGTPAVMAYDLARAPRTDIVVQASGDAHLSNFGLFGSPERTLVFDANDFDETLPGPWEWDVKRLAASVVIAGRTNGFNAAQNRDAAMRSVRSYRQWIARYASMSLRDVWYASITDGDIRDAAEQSGLLMGKSGLARRQVMDSIFSKARRKDGLRAFESLTAVVDGRRVILDDPPAIKHVPIDRSSERDPAVLHRLSSHARRESTPVPGAVPLRRCRTQGRRRRERRDPLPDGRP